jgi:hypothetical protein
MQALQKAYKTQKVRPFLKRAATKDIVSVYEHRHSGAVVIKLDKIPKPILRELSSIFGE